MSEDVDLYADDRRAVVRRLTDDLPEALRREFPRLRWEPAPDAVRQPGYALLVPDGGLPVRVQVLDGGGYRYWPTERRPVDVRYADVPPVELVVPTRAAFAGMKLYAWADRRAPRDLYDLWALALLGAVDAEAVAVFTAAVGYRPSPSSFDRWPDPEQWRVELAHQTAVLPEPEEAAAVVREALIRAA
jgi:hypothetical protein